MNLLTNSLPLPLPIRLSSWMKTYARTMAYIVYTLINGWRCFHPKNTLGVLGKETLSLFFFLLFFPNFWWHLINQAIVYVFVKQILYTLNVILNNEKYLLWCEKCSITKGFDKYCPNFETDSWASWEWVEWFRILFRLSHLQVKRLGWTLHTWFGLEDCIRWIGLQRI